MAGNQDLQIKTSFSNDATNNKPGRTGVDPSALDRELMALAEAESETRRRLGMLQRDDGLLKDAAVQVPALSRQVLNLMGGFNLRGVWLAQEFYDVNDVVDFNGSVWVCQEKHNAGTVFEQPKFKRFGFSGGEDAALAATQAGNYARAAAASQAAVSAAEAQVLTSAEAAQAQAATAQTQAAEAKAASLAARTSMNTANAANQRAQNAAVQAEAAAQSQGLAQTRTIDHADNAVLTGFYVAAAGGPSAGEWVVKVTANGPVVYQTAENATDGSVYQRTVNTDTQVKTPWVRDGVHPADLSSSDPGKGVDLVAGAVKMVPDLAALRAVTGSANRSVVVTGYSADAPGVGGGVFTANPADTTTPDNGGTVIVGADGTRWHRQYETLSVCDFGAYPGADVSVNDAAFAAAAAVDARVYVPAGVFDVTAASAPYWRLMHGEGFVRLAGTVLPAGNITDSLVIPFPSVMPDIYGIFEYLSVRRIDRSALVTVAVDAGTHDVPGPGINPAHPDGKNIHIVGKGSADTSLRFTGFESAKGQAAIKLEGNFTLGLISRITLDGNNWLGHANANPNSVTPPPALGPGDVNDPMGLRAREGAVIVCGPDVRILRFARNGVMAYLNAHILADGVVCVETGSDSFVASMSSSVRAIRAKSVDCWGVGFYADYGGTVWANYALADGVKVRTLPEGGPGGQGFSAVGQGFVLANDSRAVRCAREGYLAHMGVMQCERAECGSLDDDAMGNGVIDPSVPTPPNPPAAGSIAAVAARHGGALYGYGMKIGRNNGPGVVCEGSYANINNAVIANNRGHGIRCTVRGAVMARGITVTNNSGYGILARTHGVVDCQGVSAADKVTGNTQGVFSATRDGASGLGHSVLYIHD